MLGTTSTPPGSPTSPEAAGPTLNIIGHESMKGESGEKAYVVYIIEVTPSGGPSYKIQRRYKSFHRLYAQVFAALKEAGDKKLIKNLPKIPGKKLLSFNTLSEDTIRQRTIALGVFLNAMRGIASNNDSINQILSAFLSRSFAYATPGAVDIYYLTDIHQVFEFHDEESIKPLSPIPELPVSPTDDDDAMIVEENEKSKADEGVAPAPVLTPVPWPLVKLVEGETGKNKEEATKTQVTTSEVITEIKPLINTSEGDKATGDGPKSDESHKDIPPSISSNTTAGETRLDLKAAEGVSKKIVIPIPTPVDKLPTKEDTGKEELRGVSPTKASSMLKTVGGSSKKLFRGAVKAVEVDNKEKVIEESMRSNKPLIEEAVPELHKRLKHADEMWFLGFIHNDGLDRMTKLLVDLEQKSSVNGVFMTLLLIDCFKQIMSNSTHGLKSLATNEDSLRGLLKYAITTTNSQAAAQLFLLLGAFVTISEVGLYLISKELNLVEVDTAYEALIQAASGGLSNKRKKSKVGGGAFDTGKGSTDSPRSPTTVVRRTSGDIASQRRHSRTSSSSIPYRLKFSGSPIKLKFLVCILEEPTTPYSLSFAVMCFINALVCSTKLLHQRQLMRLKFNFFGLTSVIERLRHKEVVASDASDKEALVRHFDVYEKGQSDDKNDETITLETRPGFLFTINLLERQTFLKNEKMEDVRAKLLEILQQIRASERPKTSTRSSIAVIVPPVITVTTSVTPLPEATVPPVVDERFAKYDKMKRMLPEGAVRQKMTQDGISATDIELFWSGAIGSTTPTLVTPALAPVADERFAKYEKMKKMLPEGAVRQKMTQDGISASDIELFWSGVTAAPASATPALVPSVAPAVDERFAKYEKMKKMLPEGAVRQKMTQDGVSAADIELFWSGASAVPASATVAPVVPTLAPVADERFAKYEKMKKMLPEGAVRQKMVQDGITAADVELFWSGATAAPIASTPTPVPSAVVDERFSKYEKMKKMLPEGAVRQKMAQDGITAVDIDLFWSGATAVHAATVSTPIAALVVDEIFAKYEKMKKMLPDGAIIQKMTQDGISPADIERFFSLFKPGTNPLAAAPTVASSAAPPKKKGPKLKPVGWTKIKASEIKDSIWSKNAATNLISPEDATILEEYFLDMKGVKDATAGSGPAETDAVVAKARITTLLSGDKIKNYTISSRRITLSPPEILQALQSFEADKLSTELLDALAVALPDDKDKALISGWLGKHPIEGDKDAPPLGPAEVFMSKFLTLTRPKEKIAVIRCQKDLHLRLTIPQNAAIKIHETVDQLHNCEDFFLFLKLVLELGNFLNQGTFRENSLGVKISEVRDALLKTAVNPVKRKVDTGPEPFRPDTAFHFLADQIARKYPTLISDALNDALDSCHGINNLKIDAIESTKKDILSEFATVKAEVAACKEDKLGDLKAINNFIREFEPKIAAMEKQWGEAVTRLRDITLFFGEVFQDDKPLEIFNQVSLLLKTYEKVSDDNDKQIDLNDKKWKKKLAQEEALKKKAEMEKVSLPNKFQNALDNMKSGNFVLAGVLKQNREKIAEEEDSSGEDDWD